MLIVQDERRPQAQDESARVSQEDASTDESLLSEHEFDVPTYSTDENLSWWQKVRRFFYMSPSERYIEQEKRLGALTDAIERYPNVAVNYLLRAELYVARREYALAQADYQRALDLAPQQYDADRWGISAQATQDSAQRGLEKLRDKNLI